MGQKLFCDRVFAKRWKLAQARDQGKPRAVIAKLELQVGSV